LTPRPTPPGVREEVRSEQPSEGIVLEPTPATAGPRPIDPEEFLLRRVHRSFFTPDEPFALFTRGAFTPTREDTDGLSLQREQELAEAGMGPAAMSAAGRKPGEYFVVRLKAKVYLDLGLRTVPDQSKGDLPGHVVIPELSLDAYNGNKTAMKDVQEQLIRLASAAEAIVLRPGPLPA
jgi:hypothetical protein